MSASARDASRERPGYVVGDLEIDVGRQRVLQAGMEIPLPKLSYDLLIALIETAPDVVSNADLIKRVWPGLVVSERTVTQRVKLLRDALGDDSQNPRYIVGLRGRGYSIGASVVRVPMSVKESTEESVPTTSRDAEAASCAASTSRPDWGVGGRGTCFVCGARNMWLRPPDRIVGEGDSERVSRSVAVLPFRNLSVDSNDAYLALGIPGHGH